MHILRNRSAKCLHSLKNHYTPRMFCSARIKSVARYVLSAHNAHQCNALSSTIRVRQLQIILKAKYKSVEKKCCAFLCVHVEWVNVVIIHTILAFSHHVYLRGRIRTILLPIHFEMLSHNWTPSIIHFKGFRSVFSSKLFFFVVVIFQCVFLSLVAAFFLSTSKLSFKSNMNYYDFSTRLEIGFWLNFSFGFPFDGLKYSCNTLIFCSQELANSHCETDQLWANYWN